MPLTKAGRAGRVGGEEHKDRVEVMGDERMEGERGRRGGAAVGERGGAVIHRDAAQARLSGRGDRLSSSVLISAFNTLNNRACGACRAHRFGAVRVVRRSYRADRHHADRVM